jgi:hypothetical protein
VQVLNDMDGELHTLLSVDSVADEDPRNKILAQADQQALQFAKNMITPEELHMRNPPGFPYHELELKVGAICMIVRNIDVSAGLVNGTRVEVLKISRDVLRVKVLTGNDIIIGRTIDLMRITFIGEVDNVIMLSRIQFPLKVAFGMTINKSQGQTLDRVSLCSYFCLHFSSKALRLDLLLCMTLNLICRLRAFISSSF